MERELISNKGESFRPRNGKEITASACGITAVSAGILVLISNLMISCAGGIKGKQGIDECVDARNFLPTEYLNNTAWYYGDSLPGKTWATLNYPGAALTSTIINIAACPKFNE